ncbi:MAG: hypothetical protein JRI68_33590, partial [Deltaproteobacteria bacterium]|nr:hypothetical protein [Deltaproteobacteria bacterium]
GNTTEGIVGFGGDQIAIESTVVRNTLPKAADGMFGRGMDVTHNVKSPTPPVVTVHGSRFEHNATINLFFAGASATVTGTLMQGGGRGLHVQAQQNLDTFATLALDSSVVTASAPFGVVVYDAEAHVANTLVDATSANEGGDFGDGVNVTSDVHVASAFLTTSLVSNSIRAGVSNFGSFVSIGDSALRCHGFDMDGEVYDGRQPSFENRGGNWCGCSGQEVECKAVSAGLSAPPAVGTTPE